MVSDMKAIRFHQTGDVDVIVEDTVPVPQCGPTQVVIRTELAGLNFIDLYYRTGLYPCELPRTLGEDLGGKIVEVGAEVRDLQVGDRVVALAAGAMAEHVVVESMQVVKVPDTVDLRSATAVLLQGLTAVTLTHVAYAVQPDDWVLVHAAAGGVGLLLVQVVKALGGRVIGTTSTEKKAALVRSVGADHVLLYGEGHASAEENAHKVLELTGGGGVQVVYDSVGATTWDANFTAVARLGTLVSFGQSSGVPPALPLARLSAKNVRVLRPSLFRYLTTREEVVRYTGVLFGLLAANRVQVHVWREYLFGAAGVQEAQRDLRSRTTSGKLLIRVPLYAERA